MDKLDFADYLLTLALCLGSGLVGARIGQKKGYGSRWFFLLGFICFIPGLILAYMLPAKH